MSAIVRDAFTHEFDDIAKLLVEAYSEYASALTPENWQTMQTNLSKITEVAQQGRLIIAQLDRELVGAVVYCPPGTSDTRIFQPEWASLRMLAVSPQHRGQGIGAQLSSECIRRAKEDEAEIIGLHTSELMLPAIRMYERLGFDRDLVLPRRLGIQFWRYVLKLND
ncbi:GNAT family N-acetyltransferase [Chamaesiphon polymorphus]|uniref:GNAT family N-acetyltransferase n=1 Tax=Chamaesiphon polymorphus CCALA 037 TaxID=2107692 RepID=A0A2T1GMF6_9CYAN|nr:GNAT family N-acetyltransferase [Chamaesiphon polymorphus]PSB59070.1 GNAT family N-acetyltransferase [Chamaesiphon polymorphus CCALA 037]